MEKDFVKARGDEPFGAEEALRLGLVNALLPQAELLPHAMGKAAVLAAKPRAALLAIRRPMRSDAEAIKARMAEETRAFSAALKSPMPIRRSRLFWLGGRSLGRINPESTRCGRSRLAPGRNVRVSGPSVEQADWGSHLG
jgi:hypothetical protein